MSGIATMGQTTGVKAAAPAAKIYRAATFADIDLVHARLGEVIAELPYYNAEFKAHETARLSKDFLAALIEADPHHVMIFMLQGETAGFMISGPELGTLWHYWTYLFPEKRQGTLGVRGIQEFFKHWDNGRFHKVATYTMPGNDRAQTLMERFGYVFIVKLEQQLFGQDCLLYEHKLNKTVPGYDHSLRFGFRHRLRRKIKMLLARNKYFHAIV
ncbi:GNAT family protein [Devosia sp.]|uniref:GNAT family protein n=1 Tax=Devosia sp. TaxID=1871048 RepID=UPI0032660E62